MFKIFLFIVIPSFIIWVFYITYKYFNRNAPDPESKEGRGYDEKDFV